LEGLVVVDVEFTNKKIKIVLNAGFLSGRCHQELAFAGGMLAGKKYKDIEKDLKRYNIKRYRL